MAEQALSPTTRLTLPLWVRLALSTLSGLLVALLMISGAIRPSRQHALG